MSTDGGEDNHNVTRAQRSKGREHRHGLQRGQTPETRSGTSVRHARPTLQGPTSTRLPEPSRAQRRKGDSGGQGLGDEGRVVTAERGPGFC